VVEHTAHKGWQEALAHVPDVAVVWEKPLAPLTSMRVGGPAEAWVSPQTVQAAERVWCVLQEHQVPWCVLGGGTNVVVSDAGLRGAVIDLSRGFGYLEETPLPEGGALWNVGAGCGTGRVVRRAVDKGLAGAEVLAGVPGSMGGALIMNAGGHEGEIKSVVKQVQAVVQGQCMWIQNAQAGFAYRSSAFPEKSMVLGAHLLLRPGDKPLLAQAVKESQERRRRTQPLTFPNAGSFFKNPPGHAAGRLIELSGCKGWQEGAAEVSVLHANFIVNKGGALASDIVRLARRVRDHVHAHTGVLLQFEVKLLGDFHP
jgi:UDP-N-acetylmuramate dehydrogenase